MIFSKQKLLAVGLTEVAGFLARPENEVREKAEQLRRQV
jgi:hypothetical protein